KRSARSPNVSHHDRRMRTRDVVRKRDHTREAPRDFISSQFVWSRRSFVKTAVAFGGIQLLNVDVTKTFAAIQHTALGKGPRGDPATLSIREAGDLVRRRAISPVDLT